MEASSPSPLLPTAVVDLFGLWEGYGNTPVALCYATPMSLCMRSTRSKIQPFLLQRNLRLPLGALDGALRWKQMQGPLCGQHQLLWSCWSNGKGKATLFWHSIILIMGQCSLEAPSKLQQFWLRQPNLGSSFLLRDLNGMLRWKPKQASSMTHGCCGLVRGMKRTWKYCHGTYIIL